MMTKIYVINRKRLSVDNYVTWEPAIEYGLFFSKENADTLTTELNKREEREIFYAHQEGISDVEYIEQLINEGVISKLQQIIEQCRDSISRTENNFLPGPNSDYHIRRKNDMIEELTEYIDELKIEGYKENKNA